MRKYLSVLLVIEVSVNDMLVMLSTGNVKMWDSNLIQPGSLYICQNILAD